MLLLQSLFLWVNFAVCGYLLWSAPKHDDRPGTKLRKLPAYFWFWQSIAALVVVTFGFSPWHLLWTAPVSFLIAFIFDKLLFPTDYLLPSTSSRETVYESAKYIAAEAKSDYLLFLESNPRLVTFVAQQGVASAQQLAMLLCSHAQDRITAGDTKVALTSLRYSLQAQLDNPVAWITLAEVHLSLKDRCAGHWAHRLIDWGVQAAPDNVSRVYLSDEGSAALAQMRVRMSQISYECGQHPEWHDSSVWLRPYGLE